MRVRILLLIFVTCVAASCFEPSGKIFTKIPPQDYSGVKINLANTVDTVYVDEPTQLQYTLATADKNPRGVALYLNDVSLYDDYGTFTIDPANYQPGAYVLKLVLTVQTGDGSLVDRLGESFTDITHLYVLIIEAPPQPVRITAFDSTGGTMTVRWEKFAGRNFQHYTITKSFGPDYNTTEQVVISSRDQNFWNDVNFVGGQATYWVSVQSSVELQGPSRLYRWIPKTSFTLVGKRPVISWSKMLYYKNVKNITVNSVTPLTVADTSFTSSTDLAPGELRQDNITITSALTSENYKFQIYSNRGKLLYNVSMPFRYNQTEKVYYAYPGLNSFTEVLDENFNVLTQSYSQLLSISPQGNHVMTSITGSSPNPIAETNPRTLQTFNQFENAGFLYGQYSAVSDNGVVAFYNLHGNYAVQLPDYNVIYESHHPHYNGIIVSPTGEFLVDNDSVYRFDGTRYKASMKISGNDYMLFSDANTLITVSSLGLFQRIDVNANSIVVSNTLPPVSPYFFVSPYFMEYDDVSKMILIWTISESVIIDAASGQITHTVLPSSHIANGNVFLSSSGLGEFIVLPYSEL